MRSAILVLLLAACGSAPPKARVLRMETAESATRLARASQAGDARALRRMFADQVVVAGLWFADPACARELGTPTKVTGPRLDLLATCLAKLPLETTKQHHILPDVVVMTYSPGIEVEARIVGDADDPQLTWIGFADAGEPAAPTITAATLEALRDSGDPHPAGDGFAAIHVCIDPTGAIASTQVRLASALEASRRLEAGVHGWHFRPFILAGQPSAACALVTVGPPGLREPERFAPFPTPHGEPMLWPRIKIVQRGTSAILPIDVIHGLRSMNIDTVVGAVMFCVDTDGRVYGARTIRTTGLPRYDAQLLESYRTTRFEPYRDGDRPTAFCIQQVSATRFDSTP